VRQSPPDYSPAFPDISSRASILHHPFRCTPDDHSNLPSITTGREAVSLKMRTWLHGLLALGLSTLAVNAVDVQLVRMSDSIS
jgi:hypothetical protein